MAAKDLPHALAGRTEQAGVLVATAGVPRSFQRTLMPRSTVDQAIITGASMVIHYALAALTQDSIEALAQWRHPETRSEFDDRSARRRTAKADAVAWVAGWGIRTAFSQRPGERLTRGSIRTAGLITTRTSLAGLLAAMLQEGTLALEERTGNKALRNVPVAVLGGAGIAAADQVIARRRAAADDTLSDGDEWRVATGKSLAIGGMVAGGLTGMAVAERALADGLANRLSRIFPGRQRGWRNAGHAATLAGIGAAMSYALHRGYRSIEAAATTFEPGGENPPKTEYVSGGPGSLVPYDTLARQGRRHVHSYVRPEWIERVMGEPARAHPIRAFVGLDSAPSMEERVELAMRELERVKAFDRSLLLMVSPTGTGYVNYAAVESTEYMTRGDCATVTLQYSKRPSPLSLGRVDVGREQNYMLVQMLYDRIQKEPAKSRPRLVLFGESLGAHTSQDAFVHRGTRGLMDRGVDAALWIGTPFGSRWKEEVLGKPRFDVDRSLVGVFNAIEDYEALAPAQRESIRYVMLTHHNDAVAYFGPDLLVSCPPWLGEGERPPGVPRAARYGPVLTFLQTLVDMKNSANVIPGKFEAKGHDYRADLARFVRAVYRLEATDEQIKKIEEAMVQAEVLRARWIEDHKKERATGSAARSA